MFEAIEAGCTLVVPSRRAAFALLVAYAARARAKGLLAWPTPDVVTFAGWRERVWRGRRGDTGQRLLSGQQAGLVWERIVSESSWAETLLSPSSAARTAQRSWELAQAYRIPLGSVDRSAGDEARAFLQWATAFEGWCRTRSWVTSAQIAAALTQDCSHIEDVRLFVTEPEHLTPAEEQLLQRLAANGNQYQLATCEPPAEQIEVHAAPQREAELERAARWARRGLENGLSRIGVVVPELAANLSRVRHIFEDVLEPGLRQLGRPRSTSTLSIAASPALAAYPVVRSALDVLELAQGEASSTLAGGLLRSPFLAGFALEGGARALADVRLRRLGGERFDCGSLERLAAACTCPDLANRLRDARKALDTLRGTWAPSYWAERFPQLWRMLGWPGERSLDTEEQQTVAKLSECLAEFGSLDELLGSLRLHAAVTEFTRLVTTTAYEPRTAPAPVTIIDPQTVAGMHFEALWVAGLEASRWPPAPEPDPFLPIEAQRRAGVPTASPEAVRRLWRARFERLMSSADQIVFSWARFEDDAALAPSPSLDGLPVADFALDVPRVRSLRQSSFAARPALESVIEVGAPPLASQRSAGGARVLELQAKCPFRAQAELRLGAIALDRVGPGIDAQDRGNLVHAALYDLWRELGGQSALRQLGDADLAMRVRRNLRRRCGKLLAEATPHRARLVEIELEVAERKILELLQLERERPAFKVLGLPESEQFYALGGVELSLRIDRIDELESGGQVVIDYKTGSSASPAGWWGERPEQPQLPLYAVARRNGLVGVAFALLSASRVSFTGVTRDAEILPGVAAYPGGRAVPSERADWARLLESWERTLERLATDFAAGVATVDPLPRACRLCHLSTLCRINEGSEARADRDREQG